MLAADQFIITPAGRVEDAARAHAAGDEVRTVIAGYHWFTDWGRDTMISLEGLTLATGRHAEAGYILRTFAHYVRDGLIPNMFPEGEKRGPLPHRRRDALVLPRPRPLPRGDRRPRRRCALLLPDAPRHRRPPPARARASASASIPADGLLRQGAEGYQLTWMDAKVDDWVVTPRRGKAVEINALWYNALRLLEGWVARGARRRGGRAARRARRARARRRSTGASGTPSGGYLYDVVDGEDGGDDPACRPNQVFAISLRPPGARPRRAGRPVLDVVRERLLTPVGPALAGARPSRLQAAVRRRPARPRRRLPPGHGLGLADRPVRRRLAEGPSRRPRRRARASSRASSPHLGEACIGSISEIFDAEAPYTPRGCIAQAWSVAEVLRCWVKTARPEEVSREVSVHEEEVLAG